MRALDSTACPVLMNSPSTHWSVTPYGQFSIRSNVSTEGPQRIWGHLDISMNSNKASQEAYLAISMHASDSNIMAASNVCFAQTDDACDLALYVRSAPSFSVVT